MIRLELHIPLKIFKTLFPFDADVSICQILLWSKLPNVWKSGLGKNSILKNFRINLPNAYFGAFWLVRKVWTANQRVLNQLSLNIYRLGARSGFQPLVSELQFYFKVNRYLTQMARNQTIVRTLMKIKCLWDDCHARSLHYSRVCTYLNVRLKLSSTQVGR